MKRKILKILNFVPLLDRYLISVFFGFLFIVNLTSFVILLLTLSLYYFNISKTYSPTIWIKYALFTSLGYYIFVFPITLVISFLLFSHFLLRKRLIYIFFSNGINPKRLTFPFLSIGLVFTLFYLIFFEFVYPVSMLKSKEAYYESKKKVLNTGIAEDFWYKENNSFLYFRILDLRREIAYNGFQFKVNKEFQIEEISPIEEANFKLNPERITFNLPERQVYTFRGVKREESQTREIPYDIKLLKVKRPDFISLTGLIDISLKSQFLKVNLTNFVWELWKRIEFSVFIFLLTFLTALRTFKIWFKRDLFKNFVFLSTYTLLFFAAIFVFQTLVSKISVKPTYSLGLLFIFTLPLILEWKKEN